MSHFTVMVIGENVEKQLAPYHEFECTGVNDEFVQDVDQTDEARETFAASTERCLKATDGSLHQFFDGQGNWRPEFSQPDPEAPKYAPTRRTRFVPAGYEQVEVPTSQLKSFADWAADYYGVEIVPFGQIPDEDEKHKYGYILLDAANDVLKVVDRTNPNKEWDWWVIGGRWSGFLQLKPGATGQLGERGVMGSHFADGPGRADSAVKGNIDFDGMRNAAANKAALQWDKAAAARAGRTWHTWEHVRDVLHAGDLDAARKVYHAQEAKEAVAAALDHPWDGVDEYLTPRETYIQQARDRAIAPYALVKDGQWVAKGQMGWFGMSSDDISQDDWNRKVNELLESLPDDTLLTLVDCHI